MKSLNLLSVTVSFILNDNSDSLSAVQGYSVTPLVGLK